ncbi:MAG: glycosyltransferase family 9 protein, partial [Planctomycetota bacterium]
ESFARGLGVLDEVRTIDVGAAGYAAIGWRILRLVSRLRRQRYDRLYDFEFFTRFSAVVSELSGVRQTAGFAAPSIWRGGFHSATIPFNRYWHVARNFRALAEGENGREVSAEEITPLRQNPRDLERVEALLAERGVEPGSDYIVLNPNAGRLSLERRWPAENFAELAGRLEADGNPVVLIGAAAERSYVEDIVLARPELSLVNLAGELSVHELGCLLSQARAVCSNDSGPMHLAAALGTPTVGLFGPETPVMYAPLGRRTLALWDPPVCSPCINVHENKMANCVRGFPECLTNLSVDGVFAALRRVADEHVLIPRVAQADGVPPKKKLSGTR